MQTYSLEEKGLLQRIVTRDVTCVHHYKQRSKEHSIKWKRPTSANTNNLKSQASAGNVMLPLFRDCNGPVMEYSIDQGITVSAASYTEILKSKLKPAICKRRTDFPSQYVLLFHQNERPLSTAATVEATNKLVFKLLARHPPPPTRYILDLALTDYSMFGYQKKKHFARTKIYK
jgi:hypothetical protein